jgi:uncharacterized iron-regulated membrane protein
MAATDNDKKNSKTVEQGGFRQAQAWLHTWCGLWFSWLLFAVFLTGTLAVFDEPITHWMTPEHHAEEEAAAAAAKGAVTAARAQRLAWGMAYMAEHHPTAQMWELWPSDANSGGELKVYWFDTNGAYAAAALDPSTGRPIAEKTGSVVRGTLGGHHFVDFHYELHAGTVGLWIVGIAAMAMLVALVSGVITHKRIFKDFFTFRPKKGQRSWLDAHNAVAVLTLPFQFMIAYTGIVISGTTFMPAGKLVQYGAGTTAQSQFAAELGGEAKAARTGRPMPVPDLEALAARGQQLTGQPVRAVVIDHPGDAGARIGVYGWNSEGESLRRLSGTSGMALFSAATGEVQRVRLPGGADGGAAMLAQSAMGGLHMVTFGGWGMKWLYFLCGLAGTAMMGTGAILFIVKRRHKHLGEFGGATARVYRLVEALNVAAIAGLAVACVGFLWANRLIPVAIDHRAGWELRVFFGLWALSLVHAFVRQPARAWREQLGALAALCLLLPVLNFLTTGDHLPAQLMHGDWESSGVELGAVAFGIAALGALRHLRNAQRKKLLKASAPRPVAGGAASHTERTA